MDGLEAQLHDYSDELLIFKGEHKLPDSLFATPDHVGVKAADSADFDRLLELYKPSAREMTCVRKDKRLLATAHLIIGIEIGEFGSVNWLEIMEPRRDKVSRDRVGLDHVEFYQPNFPAARVALSKSNIYCGERDNGSHAWLEVTFGTEDGYEVKFNNKPLASIVAEDTEGQWIIK